MKEMHPGSTECSQEELIKGDRARVHAVQKWLNEMQRREKKKKKKKKYKDGDDDDDDDDTYHPSQDYNDDSQVDPKFRPTKRELKETDEEGDS